ncbi:MAG: hypothetical protein OES69_12055 [Myxococcales bacterium]|nr:hypothetical protein [Myxococcales bacterium]MDH3844665.1 hypothetical protein [Myxococcales bacterium]
MMAYSGQARKRIVPADALADTGIGLFVDVLAVTGIGAIRKGTEP